MMAEPEASWFDITIAGKRFNIASRHGEEHIREVERLLNETFEEVNSRVEGQSLLNIALLTALNLADQLLGEKSAKGGEEAEVDGSLQFEFQINKGKAGDKISLDQIKLKIFITRIGEETLDRILLFLDPEESKPAIVDIRSKLKLASPHKVIISLENGNLNLKAWLKAKILGGSIIEAPELKRIPVTSMKPFRDILEQIQVMSQFQLILNYLAAQGMEFDEDGKLVLF